jgi:hypothetical protein
MLIADINLFSRLRSGTILLCLLYGFMTWARKTLTQLAVDRVLAMCVGSSSITIFCDVTPYSLLEIYRPSGGLLGLNINEILPDYTIHLVVPGGAARFDSRWYYWNFSFT